MDPANPIERFLHAYSYDMRGDDAPSHRLRPFVTISRQVGAGGRTLAKTLLDRFELEKDKEIFGEWDMFDQKLVAMVADDPQLRVSVEALLSEQYHKAAEDFFRQLFSSTTHQDIVAHRMFRLVRVIAEVGKAVIVGRGGSEVTRGLGAAVSVRLVAPEATRIEHLVEDYGHTESEATESIDRLDSGRARMMRRHFGVDIDDPLLYDAIWNTGQVSQDEMADSIVAMLKRRVKAERA